MKITQKMLLVAAVTFASHSMAQGIVSQELETPAFSKKSSADRVNQANSVYQRINVERANKAPIYNTYNDYQINGDWHQEYDMDQRDQENTNTSVTTVGSWTDTTVNGDNNTVDAASDNDGNTTTDADINMASDFDDLVIEGDGGEL